MAAEDSRPPFPARPRSVRIWRRAMFPSAIKPQGNVITRKGRLGRTKDRTHEVVVEIRETAGRAGSALTPVGHSGARGLVGKRQRKADGL